MPRQLRINILRMQAAKWQESNTQFLLPKNDTILGLPKGKHVHSHEFVATDSLEGQQSSTLVSPGHTEDFKISEARQSLERTIFAPVSLATSWVIHNREAQLLGLQKANQLSSKAPFIKVHQSLGMIEKNTKYLVGGFNLFLNISQIGSFSQEGVKIKNI